MGKKKEVSTGTVLKSGIWYTISSISIRAVGIISSPIYTRMLTTADYGMANTYNSWVSLMNIFTCLCLVSCVGRAKLDFSNEYDAFLSSAQALSSGTALVILGVVYIFLDPVSSLMGYSKGLILLLFVYLIFSPSVDYMQNKYRFQYKYKENIMISFLSCIGTVSFSIALMLVFSEERYVGKILGTLLPTFLMGVYFYWKIWKEGRVLFNWEYWLYALKIALPLIPHNLALVVLVQIDRIMIKDICGESDAGIYTFGYSYAILLSIFTNAIGQAWLPWFNDKMDRGEKKEIKTVNNMMMGLGCFLSILFIVGGPEALMILGTEDYFPAKWVIVPIILGTLCQYFYTNYVDIELFHKKTPLVALSSILAAFVNYGLNLLLIPIWGYRAAAYTTLAGYIFLLLFHFSATRWVLKEKIFDTPLRLAFFLGTSAIGFGFMFLYDNVLLRYGAAVIFIGIVAMLKKDDIIKLILLVKARYTKGEKGN